MLTYIFFCPMTDGKVRIASWDINLTASAVTSRKLQMLPIDILRRKKISSQGTEVVGKDLLNIYCAQILKVL